MGKIIYGPELVISRVGLKNCLIQINVDLIQHRD